MKIWVALLIYFPGMQWVTFSWYFLSSAASPFQTFPGMARGCHFLSTETNEARARFTICAQTHSQLNLGIVQKKLISEISKSCLTKMRSLGGRICMTEGGATTCRAHQGGTRLLNGTHTKTKQNKTGKRKYELPSHLCFPLKLNDLDRTLESMYNVG